MDKIRERLQKIFRDVFDNPSIIIQDEMSAKDIEEWDSLNHIQLIVTSEQSFNIRFTTAEITNLKNVGEFLKLIKTKLEDKR